MAETGEEAPSSPQQEVRVGMRLRHARLSAGMHMRELAETAGCSESFVSKVENDKVRPSLVMLHRLAGALGLNVATFFEGTDGAEGPIQIQRAGTGSHIFTRPPREGSGISLEGLVAASKSALLEVNLHHVEPGGASEGMISHRGEEFGYVLAGTLKLSVDGKVFTLEAGDSFFFPSELSHGYANPGIEKTVVLWVNTPPTF